MTNLGADWPATCEDFAVYFIVATTVNDSASMDIELTVEDLPEEECDTFSVSDSAANADCLVGSWSAPLSQIRSSLIADTVSGQKIGSVSGAMTMILAEDGKMTSGINWLRVRSLAPLGLDPDRVLTTMVWDGGGSGTWSADQTTFTTTTSQFALDFYIVSRLDGEVIVRDNHELPPEQTSAFRGDGTARYECGPDRLITAGTDGTGFVWVRANKANTIPKG